MDTQKIRLDVLLFTYMRVTESTRVHILGEKVQKTASTAKEANEC